MATRSPESLFGVFDAYQQAIQTGEVALDLHTERLISVLHFAIGANWRVDLTGTPTKTLCEKVHLETGKSQKLDYPPYGPGDDCGPRDVRGAQILSANHSNVVVLPPVHANPEDGLSRVYGLKITGQIFPLHSIVHMSWHTPVSEPNIEALMAFEPRETITQP